MATEPSYRPHPQVAYARVGESEGVLLSLVTSRYYSVNETGMAIWEALQGGASVHSLPEALAAEYEVTVAEAERRIAEFLEALTRENLLQLEAPVPVDAG